jgi:hypothetical protein
MGSITLPSSIALQGVVTNLGYTVEDPKYSMVGVISTPIIYHCGGSITNYPRD